MRVEPNIYKELQGDVLEAHLADFLIDHWSYSCVASFARNEKAFELQYIYREKIRRSASTIAGTAYHAALEYYFTQLMKEGEDTAIEILEQIAYTNIDETPANTYKLQKTTPTIADAQAEAYKAVTACIRNFMTEKSIYLDSIAEVMFVEMNIYSWVTVNRVDVPLPLRAALDLVVRTPDGKVVIIDHKKVTIYSDADDITLTRGKQAITYVLAFEENTGIHVDEVWFIENKQSQNKDKSSQLRKFICDMSDDKRALYEVMLYEPLKRMIQAVRDPDYVYITNDQDKLVDQAELYEFWCRTQIADLDQFTGLKPRTKDLLQKRRKKIKDSGREMIPVKVIQSFQEHTHDFISYNLDNTTMTTSEKIEHTLRQFGIQAQCAHTINGYSSNTYLIKVQAGVKIGNLYRYRMDLANALNLSSVRMLPELFVHEGSSYLCIEAPAEQRESLPYNTGDMSGNKIPIGRNNFRSIIYWDLDNASTPHTLVCGATGSGKSVCLRSTMEYAKLISDIERIIVCDPKYEFCNVPGIEVINDIEAIEDKLEQLVAEMQQRAKTPGKYRYTLLIIDEFADAVASARSGKQLDIIEQVPVGPEKFKPTVVGRRKSLEENLKMLLQKGRSLGYRIMAATQRASTKVITGDAKVNFPVQICFRVPKAIDSKVVLDEEGAETLAGKGDGLLRSPEYLQTQRFQGYYYQD